MIFGLFLIRPGHGGILGISEIRIEPTGYEDPSTHEWKGSFWVITATTDTKESYLFYSFNRSQSEYFGQNTIDNKTIVPQATIKLTITPRQPYWETPLNLTKHMVYPTTYGTWINKVTKAFGKMSEDSVPALFTNVLESSGKWTKHTPFDITVEKIGNNSFSKTVYIDTIGGTETVIISNPADSSEKLMITNLGQLDTGYSAPPPYDMLTVFNKSGTFIAFNGEDARKAIQYGRDITTGDVTHDECYAFYWFGGGSIYTTEDGKPVQNWNDTYKSPAHYVWRHLPTGDYASPAEPIEGLFPGSKRDDDFWNFRVLPIEGSIFNDNPSLDKGGLSLVSYLKKYVTDEIDLDFWGTGWTITTDNRLRIYLPSGAASSLITIKVSTELADSVVYQPIVGYGTIEQCFWDSSKTQKSSIKGTDVAILKVKQTAPNSSKLTVTPSVPANIPVSVTPLKDSAIIEPNSVHTFQFEVSNLGTQEKLNSTITFTVTNDLGTVTDSQTLEFELLPTEDIVHDGTPEPSYPSGDPLFVVLVLVIAVTVTTGILYTLRPRFLSRCKK